jgi:hypothetical protein
MKVCPDCGVKIYSNQTYCIVCQTERKKLALQKPKRWIKSVAKCKYCEEEFESIRPQGTSNKRTVCDRCAKMRNTIIGKLMAKIHNLEKELKILKGG